MNNHPEISIVILNLNGEKFIRPCLQTVFESDYPRDKIKIIVVDNGSTDDSVDIIKWEFPGVFIVKNPKNYGFTEGNNIGIMHCKTEYIILLNMDSKVDKNWLNELVCAMELHKDAGACGSREQPYDSFEPKDADIEESDWIGAGATIYKKKALDEIGLFDRMYFAYSEDIDISWRLRLKNWKVLYNPRAIWHHYGRKRKLAPDDKRMYLNLRNRILLVAKFGSPAQFVKSLRKYFKMSVNKNGSKNNNVGADPCVRPVRAETVKPADAKKFFLLMRIFFAVLVRMPMVIRKNMELRKETKVPRREVDKWIADTDAQIFGI